MIHKDSGSRKGIARFTVSVLVAVAILAALCIKTQTKLSSVFDRILDVDRRLLLCVFLFSAFIHIVIGALKWRLILKWSGCRTTFAEALFVRMGSDPLRAALPFKTGELGNLAYYWRTGRMTFAESLSWVSFDKALNVAGTLFWLLAGLAALVARRAPETLRGHWGVVALGGGITVLSAVALGAPIVSKRLRWAIVQLCGRMSARIGRFGEGVLSVFENISPSGKFWLAALGVVFQLRPIIVCAILFHAFSGDFARMPDAPEFLASGSVVVAFSNVPGPQLGAGFRETALTLLFKDCLKQSNGMAGGGGGVETLVAIGLLMAVSIHIVPAFFGLPFLPRFLSALRLGQAPPLGGGQKAGSVEAGP